MTNNAKRKRAYRYVRDRLSSMSARAAGDQALLIPLDDLRLLKEGAADPSPALVSGVKALLSDLVPEEEINEHLVLPFPKSHRKKGVLPVASRKDIKKVMIIGSGPIVIGQACE